MNCCQLFLLLFCLFLLGPSFVNAKECAAAGKCYFLGQTAHAVHGHLLDTVKKECADGRCYSYKCLDKSGTVMRGTGCYEDFVKACKWVHPETKEMVKEEKAFLDPSVMVVSCYDISGCAEHAFGSFENTDSTAEKPLFGRNYTKVDALNSAKCDYDKVLTEYSKPPKDKVQCVRKGSCRGGLNGTITNSSESTVTCDACAAFVCTNDKKEVLLGQGCLSDFEKICTTVPEDAKKKIRANKQDYFYYDENALVAACSFGDNCNEEAFDQYAENVNAYVKFITNLNQKYTGTCEYKLAQEIKDEKDKQDGKKGKGNGANGFELSGLVLLGLLSLYLW